MSATLTTTTLTQTFDADELGEFLMTLEEHDFLPEEESGEYSLFAPFSGKLIAYFHQTPVRGPAGGWLRLGNVSVIR